MDKPKTVRHMGKHTLTQEEMYSVTKELARETMELPRIQDRKAEAVAQFKLKETECQAKINRLAQVVNNGYDYREQECRVDFNPQTKRKFYISVDTDEIVDERAMEVDDFQVEIDTDPTEPNPIPSEAVQDVKPARKSHTLTDGNSEPY